MIYTRDMSAGVLDTIDLNILRYDALSVRNTLASYTGGLTSSAEWGPCQRLIVDHMNGFGPQPNRYFVYNGTKRIAVFVKHDPDNTNQRFTWYDENNNIQYVYTTDIEQDVIALLEVKGSRLSYGPDNKLVFIKCPQRLSHPIVISFFDDFGLPQTVNLEMGAFSVEDASDNSFTSISGQVSYEIDKTPRILLNCGLGAVPKEMKQFFSGLCNSPCYQVAIPFTNEYGITYYKNVNVGGMFKLYADKFTKSLSVEGSIQIDVKDLPIIEESYGEINIHSL